ncbi:MAG: penicillin-binding protein activator [Nitrospirota bacterium]|mgnify:CR=1 FL=1
MLLRPVIVLSALLLLIALTASLGCAPALAPEPQWEKDAQALIDHAEARFAKKQYEQAGKAIEGFFTTYPESRHTDRALSLMGEIQLTTRNYKQALNYYTKLIERYPASSLIGEAKYKIGLCYFELKEYGPAVDNLEDRSRIAEPAKLRRISEMLSTAYLEKKNYPAAIKEFVYLTDNAPEKQRPGYRDRVREIVEKNLVEAELRTLTAGTTYPSDIAHLRLAGLQIEQRNFTDAIKEAKAFLERFPAHPEKTRAELLLAEATAGLTAPRYRLGVLVPQTGPASYFGDRVLKGIQLAVLSYNTKNPENRLELVVKDTEGSTDKAVAGLNELAAKNVVAVIGPLLSREVEALAPLLAKVQLPIFTPTAPGAGLTELSPWIFRNALTNASQAAAAAAYGLKQNLRKFVIFAPEDPYGRDLTRVFTQELARKAEILATITYPPETNDFGPYIRKLIEIDFRSQKIPIPDDDKERKKLFQAYVPTFDALYLPGYAEKVGLLIPQLAFYNITGKPIIGSNNWHTPDLIERAGRHAEGAVIVDGFYPENPDPAVKAVVDAYRSAYQDEPDSLSAQAYDAAAMVLSLLAAKKDTPAAIKEGLLNLKDFPGISGQTSFTGSGESQKKLFLILIEDGKFTLVKE